MERPSKKNIRRKGEKSMKKRLATLAIVGAMAVSAVAPMTVSAAEVDVMYVNGAEVPGGPDAGYYVTFPSNIIFTDSTKSAEQKLNLVKDADAVLPTNLKVDVTVTSTGGAQLKNASVAPSAALDYQIDFSGQSGKAAAGNETLANATATDVNVGSFTGEGSLTGSATLLDTVESESLTVPIGTPFTDMLTYTITQTTPSV